MLRALKDDDGELNVDDEFFWIWTNSSFIDKVMKEYSKCMPLTDLLSAYATRGHLSLGGEKTRKERKPLIKDEPILKNKLGNEKLTPALVMRSSDYVMGDNKTTADSYTFLVNWFERFREYKMRDFFLTGEGYGGHYVPQLADLILQNNKITNHTVINFKGIAIGNAYIDFTDRCAGTYDHFRTSALVSDETHQGIIANCNFSSKASDTKVCEKYQYKAFAEIDNIDIYDSYAPLCGSS